MSCVSVVIPTHDRLPMLRSAVDSVRSQTHPVELVVVDDGSSDGTSEWLAGLDDVRWTRLEPPRERSAARNVGLRMSHADHVLFLDDDDRLRPRAIALLLEGLREEPDAVAAVGGFDRFDEHGVLFRGVHVRRRVVRDLWPDVVLGWVGTLGRSLLRRDILEEVGAFREEMTFGEDWELWLRMTERGRVVCIPQQVLSYRVHAGQSRSDAWEVVSAQVLEEYLATLPRERSELGRRLLEARRRNKTGRDALSEGDVWVAARALGSAMRLVPGAYLSPLQRHRMRTPLVRTAFSMLVGSRGLRWIRRLRSAASSALRS